MFFCGQISKFGKLNCAWVISMGLYVVFTKANSLRNVSSRLFARIYFRAKMNHGRKNTKEPYYAATKL